MIAGTIQKLRNYLITRQQSYQQVFDKKNRFAAVVLKDLAKFCRANESAFHTDPRMHAVLEGRREVWLRVQKHLQLAPEEFLRAYGLEEGKENQNE